MFQGPLRYYTDSHAVVAIERKFVGFLITDGRCTDTNCALGHIAIGGTMKILKFTSLVLISIFLIPLDASAHCKGKHTGDHPHCTGGGGGDSGVVAPVVILQSDAISNAVSVHWITPFTLEGGSDVAAYEVRYSTSLLDETNFATGLLFERDVPIPAYDPGTPEYFTIRDLVVDTTYYFGVRAVDAGGNVSSLSDPNSFAFVTTQSTATPSSGWQVDTVAELAIDNCCSTTSAQFDSSGNPIVAWVQHYDSIKVPGRIWYGYQDEFDDWITEEVFVAGLCQICYQRPIHDFRTVPVGLPGSETPSIPALLFTHSISIKGQDREQVLVYAYRQGANDWVTEDIAQGGGREVGELGGWDGEFSMDFFYVDDIWVPTAAYITALAYDERPTIEGLMLAEREEDPGQPATWEKTPALSCDLPEPDSPRMNKVRLQRGKDGSLHAMVHMSGTNGLWALFMHRPSNNLPWEFQRTGLLETYDNMADFAVDSAGNYYFAGKAENALTGLQMLVLVEDFEQIKAGEACAPPTHTVAINPSNIVDVTGVADSFANGVSEGPIAGDSINFNTYGIYLTGDDGLSTPAVHIFQISDTGNNDVSEVRVLSRCAPGMWIRDAADRIHGDGGSDSRNFAVSEDGIAWAYNYGRSSGRYDWRFEGPETVFLARRNGNACQ